MECCQLYRSSLACPYILTLPSINGEDIVVQAPAISGSVSFIYNDTHSIRLLGVCDADYMYVCVCVHEVLALYIIKF